MTETQYWQSLRKHLAQRIYVWKINASYIKGIPDWWCSGIYQDLWIENKRIVGDAKPPAILDLTDPKKYLTPHQQEWLTRRHDEGRHVAVIIFSKVGHILLPGMDWVRPISELDYMEKAMPVRDLAERIVAIVGQLEVK